MKGGIPDTEAAARGVLIDWNTGKIKYCTQPPEDENEASAHISAEIVSSEMREFEIDNFEEMETDIINKFETKAEDVMEIASTGPVVMKTPEPTIIETEEEESSAPKMKKRKANDDGGEKEKADPSTLLDGRSLFC